MRRSFRTAALGAVVVFGASTAHAEHASVTLRYSGSNASATCPDEPTFRGLVAARLGYDPFAGPGGRTLAIDFERGSADVIGHLRLSAASDDKRTERTLRAGSDDCFELATSMALIAAVAVDPDAVRSGAPEPAPTPASTPTPAAAPAPAPTPTPAPEPAPQPEPHSARSVRLSLSALFPVGIVPAPRAGARLGAAYDFGGFSLGVDGMFLFPSSRDNPVGNGEISAHVLGGSLVPCVLPVHGDTWSLGFCAVGTLGALRSTAHHVTRAEPSTDLFSTLGPRAELLVMLSSIVGLGASADVPVALSRAHLYIQDGTERHEVWAEPPVGFIGAVSLVLRLR